MEQTTCGVQPNTEPNGDAPVSIVVPVYNAAPYLHACADSLLGQTYRNLELIFVDDGSTDGSAAILDAYAQRDARVRVIKRPNGGVSKARNDGIDAANGAFVGFVDADDWTEPDYVERLIGIFQKHPEIGVAICGCAVHDHPFGKTAAPATGEGRVLTPRDALLYAVDLGKNYDGNLWNKLFRAEIFRETLSGVPRFRLDPAVAIGEDLLLVSEIFASGRSAYYCADRLYHYRYREDSALRASVEGRDSEFAARERVVALCAGFDRTLMRTAQLGSAKSALNLLAAAGEAGNGEMKTRMRKRANALVRPLLFARELPLYERFKLFVRILFPTGSMRLFHRIQKRRAAKK